MRCSFAVLVTVACGFNPSGSSGSAGLGAADDTTGSTTADATSGSEVGTSGSVASDTGSEAEVSGPVPPSGWMWRRELTIEVGPLELLDPLHDVPVLVVLDPARIDYAKTQPAGQDLRFTAVDGTPLPHEIELWLPGERSFVWVLLPSIDPVAGAVLHMEYGNPDAEDEQDPLRVWSNGFVAVWHLAEGCAGGSVRDSTGNDLHASCIELDDGSVFGAIGRGLELATPTQQLRVPHDAMLSFDSGVTVEAFVALDEKTIAMQEDRFAVRKLKL